MRHKIICFILSLSFLISAEIYKQIRINNVDSDDISLFQVSGIDIDHANYIQGQFIEFAISEYDLSILENLGYDYLVIHEDLQRFHSHNPKDYSRTSIFFLF